METPKKKKEQSISELKTGVLILLLFFPCIFCAFYGTGAFVINNLNEPNSYFSTNEIALLIIGFILLAFFAMLAIARMMTIIRRIIGIMWEHCRVEKEIDTTS